MRALNAKLPQPTHIQLGGVSGVSQQAISRKLERAALDATLASPATPQHAKTHLQLVSVEGAGMVFHAPPSKNLSTWMDGDLCKVVLQRRLRMPLWPEACHCTACGAAVDIWGTMLPHAGARVIGRCATTPCGTSHTMRHWQPGYSHKGRNKASCRSGQDKMRCARTSCPMDVGQLTPGSRDGRKEPQQLGTSL